MGRAHTGHSLCQCDQCVQSRLLAFRERVRSMTKHEPPSDQHTIPVRAHWRRNPGHLRKDPALRSAVKDFVKELMAQMRAEAKKKGEGEG